jgi:hypothetical protein
MNSTAITSIIVIVAVLLVIIGCSRRSDNAIASTPPANETEFNSLFHNAVTGLTPLVAIGGYSPKKLTQTEGRQAQACIRDLEACLGFASNHWQSMVFIAKGHQALGEHRRALDWLIKAMDIEKNDHVIPKEASLEAVHLRDIKGAVFYSAEAIRRKPNDPELMGNHAVNLLIAGDDILASRTIQDALAVDPSDEFNKRIAVMIADVGNGKKARPTCENVIP